MAMVLCGLTVEAQGAVISEVLLRGVELEVDGGVVGIPEYVEVYSGSDAGNYELVVADVRSAPGRVVAVVGLGAMDLAQTVVVHEGVWPEGIMEGVVGVGSRRVGVESLGLLEVFGGSRSLLLFDGITGLRAGDQLQAEAGGVGGVAGLGGALVGSLTYRVDVGGVGLGVFPLVVGAQVVEAIASESIRRRWVGGDYVEGGGLGAVDVGSLFVGGGLLQMESVGGEGFGMNPGFANRPSEAVVAVPEAGGLGCWIVVGSLVLWRRQYSWRWGG